MDTTELFSEIM